MNEDASGQYIDHIGANQDGHFFPEKMKVSNSCRNCIWICFLYDISFKNVK